MTPLQRFRHAACTLLLAVPAVAWSRDACPPPVALPAPDVVRAAAANARDHGFLWRISKDGRTSYLYGTIHVGKVDWMFPGPAVLQALSATDTLALELDPLDAEIQARMAKGFADPPKAALPEPLAQRMRKQKDALCVGADGLGTRIPELQMVALTLLAARSEGLESAFAIDVVLASLGHRGSKHVVSLETPEGHLRLLQMDDPKDTAAFVQIGLDDLENGRARAKFNRLTDVWINSDYGAMERFGEWCECLASELERKLMTRLLDERNPGLAEGVDALHRSGRQVFAAVGSLHLFGPLGLPTLLAKRGYRVEFVAYRGAANDPPAASSNFSSPATK